MSQSIGAGAKPDALDHAAVVGAYRRWAPVYDVIFGAVFDSGRRAAIDAVNRHGGGRVLEVGVGTGLALPSYRRDAEVVGIDLSHHMLGLAAERVRRERLDHIRGVAVMDASRTAFPDAGFDVAVAMFLITTVPDPEGVMAEMERVVRPGGEIVMVNHFAHEGGVKGAVEQWLAARAGSLGWRPDFPIDRVLGRPGLDLLERRKLGLMENFTLLRFRKRG
ncbi:MAG TPA: class I SAM-dependent methyltransferase [Hyphomicrobiales bacterium]|nr:class I SAM-dependent methyltransferase [Hyphomicrobiales bacterium]